jgi:hypothetical protein
MREKRSFLVITILVLVFFVSGCAQISDKFVRKPKKEETAMRYRAVKTYEVHPSLELYTKRYVFWKNWHREALDLLAESDRRQDFNQKKMVVSLEQEVSNLIDMQNMLIDEKAGKLQPLIDQMAAIEAEVKKNGVTQGNAVRIRRTLETTGRSVKESFSYNKIRGCIRDEFSNEPQS